MPRVILKYLAPLCDLAGTYHDQADVAEGATLVDLAEQLAVRYGTAFRKLLFDEAGRFRPQFIIVVNGQPDGEFVRPLQDGDRVTFIPPVAGG
jgi:MoaD family protein